MKYVTLITAETHVTFKQLVHCLPVSFLFPSFIIVNGLRPVFKPLMAPISTQRFLFRFCNRCLSSVMIPTTSVVVLHSSVLCTIEHTIKSYI